jgi:hypothetical protein
LIKKNQLYEQLIRTYVDYIGPRLIKNMNEKMLSQPPEFVSIDLINKTLNKKPLSLTYSYSERILNFFGGRSFTFRSTRWDSNLISELSRDHTKFTSYNSIEKMKSVIEIAKERRFDGISSRNLTLFNPNHNIVKRCYVVTRDRYGDHLYEQLMTNDLTTPKLKYKLIEAFTNYYSYHSTIWFEQSQNTFLKHYNHIIRPCYLHFRYQSTAGPTLPSYRDYFERKLLRQFTGPSFKLKENLMNDDIFHSTLFDVQRFWSLLELTYTKVHYIQYTHYLFSNKLQYLYNLHRSNLSSYFNLLHTLKDNIHFIDSPTYLHTLEYYLYPINSLF